MTKEFERGYRNAKRCINEGDDPLELLNQARSSLTNDEFDHGWKTACNEELKTE